MNPSTVRALKLVLEDQNGYVGEALRCTAGAEGLQATAVVQVERDLLPPQEEPAPPPSVNVKVAKQAPSKRVVRFSDGREATIEDVG